MKPKTLDELMKEGFERCKTDIMDGKYRALKIVKYEDHFEVIRYTQQRARGLYHYDGVVEFGNDGVMRMWR